MTTESFVCGLVSKVPTLQLTGSRYFGNAGEFSDWDFFIQQDIEVIRILLNEGFQLESISEYPDLLCTKVYKHTNFPVHVQIVTDVLVKKAAQEFLAWLPSQLRESFIRCPKGKSTQNIWNWAISIAEKTLRIVVEEDRAKKEICKEFPKKERKCTKS